MVLPRFSGVSQLEVVERAVLTVPIFSHWDCCLSAWKSELGESSVTPLSFISCLLIVTYQVLMLLPESTPSSPRAVRSCLLLCQAISPTADRLILPDHLFPHVTPFLHMQQA